ncbi:NADP-dependent oxidoreductase [Sphingomonas sp. 28-63-12]|uniref:NADP-dependent oxidoreductase n=1 Tax=Sphingomonas sp. 28-63-12 TaxID=1970434 RepID=UPI000BCF05B3|nr:MAG: NADP-dependent oxidoreductase [Sphingomonas sp. 28-63-12]
MAHAWTLKSRPAGMPTHDNFAMIEAATPAMAAGMVRIANRWLSVDPYMRGRMNDVKSYTPPFVLGEEMQGGAVGEVIESQADGIAVGDMVLHMAGWRDEAVLSANQVQKLPALGVDPQAFLGQFGMPGMTAYFGLMEVASAKAGDVVFVSAAAGAVGSTLVQIAKAKGMTVIGTAGGADKCAWVKALGADEVIDYKGEGSLLKKLMAAAPKGIDVYFDNVGGEHLDAALAVANERARFAICGMINMYNSGDPTVLRFAPRIIGMRIRIQGFIVSDYMARAAEFYADMAGMLQADKLTREETVHQGLASMPDAFLGLFSGGNTGKMLVKL